VELKAKLGSALTRAIFGGDVLPDGFFIEQPQPQQEISVWVCGHGPPRNVTRCNGPASSVPCTLWVAFDAGQSPDEKQREHLWLEFRENAGQRELLGRISLKWTRTIAAGQSEILVFEPRSAANYCHPIPYRYAHLLNQIWTTHRAKSKVKLSVLQQRAMSVIFTCPRPISLVSVAHEGRENMYPLNVMGDVNDQYFAFALTACKIPAQFLQVARRFALSVAPIEQAPIAFALAANHNTRSMEFKDLPFPTRPSPKLGIAVPVFSPRVREMEIESVHTVGSHSLFVARTISDECFGNGPQLAVTHGFYQAWRLRHGLDDISSIAKDARIKAGKLSNALS
jgi:flavin reductase (DIM6/NTAB) family NADH-FMN oxidoreductase RutF